jgi:molybdopterin converting factor small subunit
MKVHLKGYLTFRERLNSAPWIELEENSTLGDLVSHLPSDLQALIEAREGAVPNRGSASIAILVNGQHYTHLPDRLNTRLEDGDEVAVFPPVSGG